MATASFTGGSPAPSIFDDGDDFFSGGAPTAAVTAVTEKPAAFAPITAPPQAQSPPPDRPAPSAILPPLAQTTAKHAIIFDIETGPLPPEELWRVVAPFDPASVRPFPEFDQASVKYGNIKDEAKKAEKLAAAEAQHRADAAAHAAKSATAKDDYERAVIERAALDALTGRVLAIGALTTKDADLQVYMLGEPGIDGKPWTEAGLLAAFWEAAAAYATGEVKLVGHNIFGFDLPFLIRRSFLLGVEVPQVVMSGRYFADVFADTMRVWACGMGGQQAFVKLDTLARAFGLPGKIGDGAQFASLWEADRKAADAYLSLDLRLTFEVAKRVRLCW